MKTGELKTSEKTCRMHLLREAPPVAMIFLPQPAKKINVKKVLKFHN
jgi:hypothetical protein